jgi:hypothetical protein
MIPFIIFLFGWVKPIYAIPLTILLAISYFFMVKHAPEVDIKAFVSAGRFKFLFAILIIIAWVAYSGVGGSFYQNPDFMGRNGVFDALVQRSWPSADLNPRNFNFSVGLVYYFLTWLPAALVAKHFGMAVGTVFLGAWVALGIILTYIIIANNTVQKPAIWALLFMISFSGLDSVGIWLTGQSLSDPGFVAFCPNGQYGHIEWWTSFQFSSNTTQLFWVFNQAVPAWLATVLVMEQKKNRSLGMILALLPLFALIPTFGLFVIVIVKIIENSKGKSFQDSLKSLVSFENIVCIPVVLIAFFFLITNVRSAVGLNWTAWRGSEAESIWALALTLEAFLWMFLCHTIHGKKPLYIVMFFALTIFSRINIGNEPDFAMRSTIPFLTVLLMWTISSLNNYQLESKKFAVGFTIIIFLLGAVTPFMEIARSVKGTADARAHGRNPEVHAHQNIFEGWKYENYAGRLDSFFFNNLARPIERP